MPIQSQRQSATSTRTRRHWPRRSAPARHRPHALVLAPLDRRARSGCAPVAMITASGCSLPRRAAASTARLQHAPGRRPAPSRARRLVTMPPNSARPGSSCASSAWPPSCAACLVERDVDDRARPATAAAFMPAGPAAGDEDALSRLGAGCACRRLSSRPVSGCWMQEIGSPVEVADAGLVAGDAGADVVERGRPSALLRHLGVARSSPASCRTCRPGRRPAPARRSAAG